MRIANLILAHKNPNQLLKLINQYPIDLFRNWVHIDANTYDRKAFSKIASHPNVTLLRSRKIVWAGYSLVKVTLDGLYEIQSQNENFTYINLMSGLDLPTQPAESFYNFLDKDFRSKKSEFFEIRGLDGWNAKHRFERYHLSDWTIKGRYFIERIINSYISKRQFYNGKMIPYGHSQWFTATSDFIKYALDFFRNNPDYLSFLKTMWGPDEFLFNSLIMNSPFRSNISEKKNLRYIDWSEGNASPKVLKMEDFEKVINSNCFIARKFDENVDKEIIEKIISEINKGI